MDRHIDYCYDPYHDLLWVTFMVLEDSCYYGVPVDRRTDVIQLVDDILTGEFRKWIDQLYG